MEISTENCWKILRGECTLPQILKILGDPQKCIDKKMDEINQSGSKSIFSVFTLMGIYSKGCYDKLVERNEIVPTTIFNVAAKDFEGNVKSQIGDLGYKGKDIYRYSSNNEWILFY